MEITDGVKNFNIMLNIINEQISFFENVKFLLCSYVWCMCLISINKKCLAGYANLTGVDVIC